jgi:hypothetical protein
MAALCGNTAPLAAQQGRHKSSAEFSVFQLGTLRCSDCESAHLLTAISDCTGTGTCCYECQAVCERRGRTQENRVSSVTAHTHHTALPVHIRTPGSRLPRDCTRLHCHFRLTLAQHTRRLLHCYTHTYCQCEVLTRSALQPGSTVARRTSQMPARVLDTSL